jgi:hypothetical protein
MHGRTTIKKYIIIIIIVVVVVVVGKPRTNLRLKKKKSVRT